MAAARNVTACGRGTAWKYGSRFVAIITLYIDADACPVKQEIYRVAGRQAGKGATLKGSP